MKVNFRITENYALDYHGRHLDLHSNFHFVNLEYKIETSTLILRWLRSKGEWVPDNEVSYLVLVHKQVNYLLVVSGDPEMERIEGTRLNDITFYPSSDRNTNDSIMTHRLPEDGDDILYLFQSDQIIRVNCEEVELIVGDEGDL
jgi:hypothetical protein